MAHFITSEVTLGEIDSMIIISVLQDCVLQLNILGQNLFTPIERCYVKYENQSKRYGCPEEKQSLEKRRVEVSLNDQILKNLQRERTFIEGIVWYTIEELKQSKKFNFLQKAVCFLNGIKMEEKTLVKTEKLNRDMVQKRLSGISEAKTNAELMLARKLEKIAQLKDKLTNEKQLRKVIINFVEQWEKNSIEQRSWRNNHEFKLKNEVHRRTANNVENEFKINENVIEHLTDACTKLEEGILRWKQKYDSDIGNLEDRIGLLKDLKQQQLNTFQRLQEVYNTRQREMNEFLAMKEERRRKETQELLEYESAVRLQSWWRGLMVRRCLGQFRRRKKVTKDPKAKRRKGGKSPKGKGNK